MKDKKGISDNPLMIDMMMYKYKYYPINTEFESLNRKIPDNNNFSKIFSDFLSKLKMFDKEFTNYAESNKTNKNFCCDLEIRSYMITYINENDKEVKDYIKEYWKEQLDINKRHTCFFLIMVDKYIHLSKKISSYDENILFWTILFHDLGKYMYMNPYFKEYLDFNYYDKTHPFKSVLIFLDCVFEHDLFFYPDDNYKNELINIYKNEFINAIYNSWSFIDKERYNISFIHIDIIEKFFMKIKLEEKNEWLYDICVLIIFHQSLPNNKNNMNSPLLEEKYIKKFFSKRLVELMRIIMIYDSSSHTLFSESEWPKEINKNMDEITKLFD